MELKDKISIIVNTCDKYYCALEPFFVLWKKYCGKLDCNIYLNMEEKAYSDNELHIININHSKNTSWSSRLKDTLSKINTDYVISLHEDFFMNDYLNVDKLNYYIDYMDKNKNVATLSLVHFYNQMDETRTKSTFADFEKRSSFSLYQLQTSGFWRKEIFYHYVRENETPWQMESYGNLRTWVGHKYEYLVLKENASSAFSFIWKNRGSAIWKGKWFVSLVDDLFKKNGIKVDYSELGCVDEKVTNINDIEPQRNLTFRFILYCWFCRIKMFIGHFDYLFHK